MSLPNRALILFPMLLFFPVFQSVSGAKEQPFLTLRGGNINTILGASREPHTMTSLKEQGAPAEYVNKDIGEINVNEGPCTFVAMQAQAAPDALYEVFVECFDLVAERESKSFSYAADSTGKVIRSGSLASIGEYAKDDPHFDVAAWNWIMKHVSSKLKHKVEAARTQGSASLPSPVYKVSRQGDHSSPRVTAPVLIRAEDAEFSDEGRRAKISGLSVVSLVIGTDGLPQHIRTLLPLGYGMDEAAVKAVQQYRFRPAKFEGKSVPVQITVEVNFHIV